MAGVKGRSGGPRTNSGGARPGAGRPKKSKPAPAAIEERDMLQLLKDIALGCVDATPNQVRAAIAAVQYTHAKKGEAGKKDAQDQAARKATSKFALLAAPKLIVNNQK